MSAPAEHRIEIGRVRVGSDALVVEIVARSWTTPPRTSSRDPSEPPSGSPIRTTAPAGVDVRREPDCGRAEPGGMTARAARELARVLAVAANRAEAIGAAPLGREVTG